MREEKLLNFIEKEFTSKYTSETTTSYLYATKRFIARFPKTHRLKLSDIESYFADLKAQGKSGEYRKAILSAIKALFDCFLELNMIKEHPCRSYFISEKKPNGKDFSSFLNLEEMEMLLVMKHERFRFVENRNKAIIGFLIYQGMTSKELIEMNLNHIDLDAGCVKIIGKGKNRNRSLELKPKQITVLMRYIDDDRSQLNTSKSNKLFIGMRGVPLTTNGLHEFIHRLGGGAFGDKEISPKNIRSSVISFWLNVRNLPLEHVQVMAGHCYPSTTEQYIKPDRQEQRVAINKLHNSIFG